MKLTVLFLVSVFLVSVFLPAAAQDDGLFVPPPPPTSPLIMPAPTGPLCRAVVGAGGTVALVSCSASCISGVLAEADKAAETCYAFSRNPSGKEADGVTTLSRACRRRIESYQEKRRACPSESETIGGHDGSVR